MTQFLEAISVGIGIIDAAGRPYYVNQRGIELMGKGVDPAATPEQLSEVYQFCVTGTDQIYPSERLPIIRALSGERTMVDDREIYQNNATIPSEAWGTPVFDEQGNVAYAIAALQDITERKQAEDLLANYNRTLEQQVAERTAALLTMSQPNPIRVLIVDDHTIVRRGLANIINRDPEMTVIAQAEDGQPAIALFRECQKYVPPAVGAKLLQHMSHPELSERELAVLRLMAQGMSNADIAIALTIGESTVKSHINRLLSKLNVGDRTQAVIADVKRGLVSL